MKQKRKCTFGGCLLLGLTISLALPAADAESEAGLSASSEASWGGWSSQAGSRASSQAAWGGWSSEASRGGYSSEAGSEAGSETGYGVRVPGAIGNRRYWRRFNNNGGGGAYGGGGYSSGYGSGYDQNEASALQRMRQEQQQQQQHEHSLATMPDSSFVQNYGSAARSGGIVDTYRRRSNPYWNGAYSGASSYSAPPQQQ